MSLRLGFGLLLRNSLMNAELTTKLTNALDTLDRAIASAAAAVRPIALRDQALSHRMESYREVVRRQRLLVGSLERATDKQDWKEAQRLTDLVRKASLMIKMDAGRILESLRTLRQCDSSPR